MATVETAPADGPRPASRRVDLPSAADLASARALVADHLAPTPIVAAELPGVAGEVLLKLESLQPTGSFKVRGALVALAVAARTGGPGTPVVTASAGNHGLGVAFAAGRLGLRATVVVPATASAAKVEALRRMDVDLVLHGDDYEAAERHALVLAGRGATYVSPYNDRHVIAGQSSMTAEVVDQAGPDITLVIPVGGGGLIAGAALHVATMPSGDAAVAAGDTAGAAVPPGDGVPRIVGAEAAASPSVSTAVAAERIVIVPIGETLADGLGGNLEPGAVTPAALAGRVHGFVQVSEDEIADAIRTLATRCGVVAEGAAAVGLAALQSGAVPVTGRPVVVVTGRNIARDRLARLLAEGTR